MSYHYARHNSLVFVKCIAAQFEQAKWLKLACWWPRVRGSAAAAATGRPILFHTFSACFVVLCAPLAARAGTQCVWYATRVVWASYTMKTAEEYGKERGNETHCVNERDHCWQLTTWTATTFHVALVAKSQHRRSDEIGVAQATDKNKSSAKCSGSLKIL